MQERPHLDKALDGKTFREFYYLKAELVCFCRENGLPAAGGKAELTDRIAYFLDTGGVLPASAVRKKTPCTALIDLDTKIETDFVCSERHRVFFKEHIGAGFSFNVAFQKWLKSNARTTYRDAIAAYGAILQEKKQCKPAIEKQFEYNTYIRDFFADNKGRSLQEAILCWNHKKQKSGHHRYEKADLSVLSVSSAHDKL